MMPPAARQPAGASGRDPGDRHGHRAAHARHRRADSEEVKRIRPTSPSRASARRKGDGQARSCGCSYAFSGPILWAVSTHIDKYLVDKYFRHSDTAVLMVFTAFLGVLRPARHLGVRAQGSAACACWPSAVMTVSGVLYMGAMLFYLRAIQSEEASRGGAAVPGQHAFHLRCWAWSFLHETAALAAAPGRAP